MVINPVKSYLGARLKPLEYEGKLQSVRQIEGQRLVLDDSASQNANGQF